LFILLVIKSKFYEYNKIKTTNLVKKTIFVEFSNSAKNYIEKRQKELEKNNILDSFVIAIFYYKSAN